MGKFFLLLLLNILLTVFFSVGKVEPQVRRELSHMSERATCQGRVERHVRGEPTGQGRATCQGRIEPYARSGESHMSGQGRATCWGRAHRSGERSLVRGELGHMLGENHMSGESWATLGEGHMSGES